MGQPVMFPPRRASGGLTPEPAVPILPARRRRARVSLLECVSDHVYGASGGEPPDWLAALRGRT